MITVVAYLLVGMVVYRLVRFITTPLFKKIGLYKYYSPMVCTIPLAPNTLEIHLGTSWDFFRAEKINPRALLSHLSEGIVNLCEAVERGEIAPDTKLKANLHFFSTTTLERFGFTKKSRTPLDIFLFSLNYPELCLLFSITNGRPSRVRFTNFKVAMCTAQNLVQNKEKYKATMIRLKQQTEHAEAPNITNGQLLQNEPFAMLQERAAA